MVYLNTAQMLPYDRLSRLAGEILGLSVSKRSIRNMLEQVSGLAKPVCREILDRIRSEPWIGSDETGMRINGKRWYQWVWQNGFDPELRESIIKMKKDGLDRLLAEKPVNRSSDKLRAELAKIPETILHFMTAPDIPWHNNDSEQSFRITKVKQKVSGCFRTWSGAVVYCRIMSIIETAKRYSIPPLDAIRNLIEYKPVFQAG
jgi:hypothetical protein